MPDDFAEVSWTTLEAFSCSSSGYCYGSKHCSSYYHLIGGQAGFVCPLITGTVADNCWESGPSAFALLLDCWSLRCFVDWFAVFWLEMSDSCSAGIRSWFSFDDEVDKLIRNVLLRYLDFKRSYHLVVPFFGDYLGHFHSFDANFDPKSPLYALR